MTGKFPAYLRKLGLDLEADFLPDALPAVMDTLLDIDVSRAIDAAHYERSDQRTAYRNGYRRRMWRTRVGKIPLRIPKLRSGTYTPEFIDSALEKSLLRLLCDAYVYGVDAHILAHWLDVSGFHDPSGDEIAQLHEHIVDLIDAHRARRVNTRYSYLWLDTVNLERVENGRRLRQVGVVALGLGDSGGYDLLAFEVGSGVEDVFFWRLFLKSLVERGLRGVELVVSDEHRGLKSAIYDVLDAEWQYSRAHALKRVLDDVPEADHDEIVMAISRVFIQSDRLVAGAELRRVIDNLRGRYPQAMATLNAQGDHLLAYMNFPVEHWTQLATLETLERVEQVMSPQVNAIGREVIMAGHDTGITRKSLFEYEFGG